MITFGLSSNWYDKCRKINFFGLIATPEYEDWKENS